MKVNTEEERRVAAAEALETEARRTAVAERLARAAAAVQDRATAAGGASSCAGAELSFLL